jgi:dTDP-4-amino-4,6-dideoxygalactose transaminase
LGRAVAAQSRTTNDPDAPLSPPPQGEWSLRAAVPEVVPAARPRLPPADRLLPYLRRIDEARIYSNWGPLCAELEARLWRHLRLPEGGFTSAASGTSALIGAILASGGRASSERPLAILPAFTFPATAAAVECCGYEPYLVDIDAETWLLDPEPLVCHPALSRVGLVVPVAAYGRPPRQDAWRRFRDATRIPVVIDGAATFDHFVDDPDPELGEIPLAMSFHATKCFAVGEGGGVACTDTDVVLRTAQALNLGFLDTRESRSPSINGKLSEYHAAVGLAELDGWTEKHAALRAVVAQYRSRLEQHDLATRLVATPDVSATYALFSCSDAAESTSVRNSLSRSRVGHRLWYERGLHHHSAFSGAPRDDLPVTEAIAPRLVGIPIAPDLADSAVAFVVDALAQGVRDGAV